MAAPAISFTSDLILSSRVTANGRESSTLPAAGSLSEKAPPAFFSTVEKLNVRDF
jgi:hypothetical protein